MDLRASTFLESEDLDVRHKGLAILADLEAENARRDAVRLPLMKMAASEDPLVKLVVYRYLCDPHDGEEKILAMNSLQKDAESSSSCIAQFLAIRAQLHMNDVAAFLRAAGDFTVAHRRLAALRILTYGENELFDACEDALLMACRLIRDCETIVAAPAVAQSISLFQAHPTSAAAATLFILAVNNLRRLLPSLSQMPAQDRFVLLTKAQEVCSQIEARSADLKEDRLLQKAASLARLLQETAEQCLLWDDSQTSMLALQIYLRCRDRVSWKKVSHKLLALHEREKDPEIRCRLIRLCRNVHSSLDRSRHRSVSNQIEEVLCCVSLRDCPTVNLTKMQALLAIESLDVENCRLAQRCTQCLLCSAAVSLDIQKTGLILLRHLLRMYSRALASSLLDWLIPKHGAFYASPLTAPQRLLKADGCTRVDIYAAYCDVICEAVAASTETAPKLLQRTKAISDDWLRSRLMIQLIADEREGSTELLEALKAHATTQKEEVTCEQNLKDLNLWVDIQHQLMAGRLSPAQEEELRKVSEHLRASLTSCPVLASLRDAKLSSPLEVGTIKVADCGGADGENPSMCPVRWSEKIVCLLFESEEDLSGALQVEKERGLGGGDQTTHEERKWQLEATTRHTPEDLQRELATFLNAGRPPSQVGVSGSLDEQAHGVGGEMNQVCD